MSDMEQVVSNIINWAISQGIGVLMMLAALFFLHNQNRKAAADLKTATDTSQKDREARIAQLEIRVNECEKDRNGLWLKVVELAQKQQP